MLRACQAVHFGGEQQSAKLAQVPLSQQLSTSQLPGAVCTKAPGSGEPVRQGSREPDSRRFDQVCRFVACSAFFFFFFFFAACCLLR